MSEGPDCELAAVTFGYELTAAKRRNRAVATPDLGIVWGRKKGRSTLKPPLGYGIGYEVEESESSNCLHFTLSLTRRRVTGARRVSRCTAYVNSRSPESAGVTSDALNSNSCGAQQSRVRDISDACEAVRSVASTPGAVGHPNGDSAAHLPSPRAKLRPAVRSRLSHSAPCWFSLVPIGLLRLLHPFCSHQPLTQ